MHFTVLDLFDADGRQLPIHQLPRHVAIGIKAIRPTKYGLQLELRDPLRAAEVRLRVFGRLRDNSVHVDPGPRLEEILARSYGEVETKGASLGADARANLTAAPQDVTGRTHE